MKILSKKLCLGATMCMLAFGTVFCVNSVKGYADCPISTDNIAGTYIEYSTKARTDWSTGMVIKDKIKDVYTTSSVVLAAESNDKYQYLSSHQGPTNRESEISHTMGTSRKTTVKANGQYKIFKAEASHEIATSKTTTVKEKFVFPGDNRKHTLYLTRDYYNKEGYVSRASYISKVTSYTYIWGVCAWNVKYGSYQSYPSRNYGNKLACDTVEQEFGTYMTR